MDIFNYFKTAVSRQDMVDKAVELEERFELLSTMFEEAKLARIDIDIRYLNPILVNSGLKFKTATEFSVLMEQHMFELKTFSRGLAKLADDLPEVMTRKTLPLKAGFVLAHLGALSNIVSYVSDTALMLTYNDEVFINPIKTRSFLEGRSEMGGILKDNYGKMKAKLKAGSALSSTYITPDESANDNSVTKDIQKTFPSKNFRGNPFYHLLLLFVDNDINAIEELNDKKKLLELRLAKLRLEAEDGADAALEKRIQYYEDAVSEKEREIQKYRNK